MSIYICVYNISKENVCVCFFRYKHRTSVLRTAARKTIRHFSLYTSMINSRAPIRPKRVPREEDRDSRENV